VRVTGFRLIFAPCMLNRPGDRMLRIMIRGANHFGFSDDLKSPIIMGIMHTLGKRLGGRRQLAVTSHYISALFAVYLKGAPASELLRGGPIPKSNMSAKGLYLGSGSIPTSPITKRRQSAMLDGSRLA